MGLPSEGWCILGFSGDGPERPRPAQTNIKSTASSSRWALLLGIMGAGGWLFCHHFPLRVAKPPPWG